MTQGMAFTISSAPQRVSPASRIWEALAALCLYAALWGGLCDMAALSSLGAVPLLLGAIALLIAALLPPRAARRWGPWGLGLALGLTAVLLFVRFSACVGGLGLLFNRLFAASEAQQAYIYEKFLFAGDEADLRYVLLPLGLASGALLGTAARRRWGWLPVLLFALFCGGAAYLGVTPQPLWLVLLALSLLLSSLFCLNGGSLVPWLGGGLTLLGALCALVFLLFPGESPSLSAWEEGARDALAGQTVAYGQAIRPTLPPQLPQMEETQFFWEEETAGDLGGGELQWSRQMRAWLVILLFALLLFLPALFSDWTRRRQARNRAPLSDPEEAAATKAAFLYALRWLRLGGLPDLNRPYSGYGEAVEAAFSPDLRRQFEAVLPLWQEAAYSAHSMEGGQRRAMGEFLAAAQAKSWEKLSPWGKFRARYIDAL